MEPPPGLYTRTAPHPDFGREVSSYAWNAGSRLVLFDPIAPLPEGATQEDVRTKLRPWLERPLELVLQTHGDPIGRADLERMLAS